MARSMGSQDTALPTRVSVLEHGVTELKAGLDSHRGETRAAFSSLQSTLERVLSDVAKRANPTNWYAIISSAAGATVILAAIFGLAEWRMTNGTQPLVEAVRDSRTALSRAGDDIVALRIQQGIMQAEHERVKIEQAARIHARVEAEQRAAEQRGAQPSTK